MPTDVCVDPPCPAKILRCAGTAEQSLSQYDHQLAHQPTMPLVGVKVRAWIRVPGRGGGRLEPKPPGVVLPSGGKPLHPPPLIIAVSVFSAFLNKFVRSEEFMVAAADCPISRAWDRLAQMGIAS